MGLYNLEMISLWGCNFQTGGLAYDTDVLSYRLDHGNMLHDNEDVVLLELEFLVA